MKRTCRLVLHVAVAAAIAGPPATALATAAKPAAILVPTADYVLAQMLLLARATEDAVLLYDSRHRDPVEHFLGEWKKRVTCLHRAEAAPGLVAAMQKSAGASCDAVNDLVAFAHTLWPEARRAVAVLDSDYPWLLRGAALAGVSGAALLPVPAGSPAALESLEAWKLEELVLTPPLRPWKARLATAAKSVAEIENEKEWLQRFVSHLDTEGPRGVVIADPRDVESVFSPSSLSLVAPLVAAHRRLPLLLVDGSDPARVEKGVLQFAAAHNWPLSHIFLVGDELALRSHTVPDPVLSSGGPEARGGGTTVRVELFSFIERQQPQEFAVGRIVAEDASAASVNLARQFHRRASHQRRPVVFLTNADEIFPLGETISRTTVEELRNLGVPVRAYYRDRVTQDLIRQALSSTDFLVWEGHSRDLTLEDRGGIAAHVAPEVVVLQGCYTLDRSDPFILMDKGTQAIVGSSAAIYSAPGSAFARSLMDSLLYDKTDLGTAVRNARNYLLALALLQRDRDHADWRKTYRAALAFALWGDPSFKPPLAQGRPRVPPVKWTREEGTLSLHIPAHKLPEIRTGDFRVQISPRTMLGGLLLRGKESEARQLKDLYFTVQQATAEQRHVCPPSDGWDVVSLYAPLSGTLSVLARPDWRILAAKNPAGRFVFPLVAGPEDCPPLATPAGPQKQANEKSKPGKEGKR